MVLGNKRGIEESLVNLTKIVLFVMFFLVLLAVSIGMWNALQGTPKSEQQMNQLNSFGFNLDFLSYLKQDYTSTYSQIYLFQAYYLVGFSSAGDLTGPLTLTKPSDCNAKDSCICIYDARPNPNKKDKNVVGCKNFPNVDYIVASELFNETIDFGKLTKKSEFTYSFSSSVGLFPGAKIIDNSQLTGSINSFFNDKQKNNVLTTTKYLGFYDSPSYYNFVVQAPTTGASRFYVELIKKDGFTFLIFFPYHAGLINRKYFINQYEGEGDCSNTFLHKALLITSEEEEYYNYCELFNSKLFVSLNKINLCEEYAVNDLCVCPVSREYNVDKYPVALYSGYCFQEIDDMQNNGIVTSLPPKEVLCAHSKDQTSLDCSYYRDNKYLCQHDFCDIGVPCEFDKIKNECITKTT